MAGPYTSVVGIDPGLTGAVALLRHDDAGNIVDLVVDDMPVVDGHVDPYALAAWFDDFDDSPQFVVVEVQQAMPRQGVASTFKTGRNYGVILGVIGAMGLRVVHVRAAEWTRALKVGADKERHRSAAMDLCPLAAHQFKRVKDDGRADAVLLAHWGAIHHERRAA